VAVWAVAKRSVYPERSQFWQLPLRAGARVVGVNVSDYLEAVDFSASVNHLSSVRDPVLIEWMPTPEATVPQAWELLGTIAAIGTFLMVALVGIVKIFSGRGRSAP